MYLRLALVLIICNFAYSLAQGDGKTPPPVQSAVIWNYYADASCNGFPMISYAIGCLNSDCTNCFGYTIGMSNISSFEQNVCLDAIPGNLPDGNGHVFECSPINQQTGLPYGPTHFASNFAVFTVSWRDASCSAYEWGYFYPLDVCDGVTSGVKLICGDTEIVQQNCDDPTIVQRYGMKGQCELFGGPTGVTSLCPVDIRRPPPPSTPEPVAEPTAPTVAPVVAPPPFSPLSISGASDVTVECDSIPSPSSVTASGGCGSISLTYTQTRTNGYCPNNYILVRQWTAVDNGGCASSISKTQTITVKDTRGPTISGVPADITVEFDNGIPQPPPLSSISASDNCDAASALSPIKYSQNFVPGPNSHTFKLYRTWSSKDSCRNAGALTQIVTVKDTIPPGVTPVQPSCLWPPNKKFYCFDDILDIRRSIIKTTGASQIRFKKCKVEDCNSNTNCPVTNRVDKYDDDDCFIRNHDDLCVRAERFNGKTRRDYYAYFDVIDAANNKVETVINVRVPTNANHNDRCKVAREKFGRRGKWGWHDHDYDDD